MPLADTPRSQPPRVPEPPSPSEGQSITFLAEVVRKAIHLFALVVPLSVFVIGREAALWLWGASAVFALSMDVLRVRSHAASRGVAFVFGRIMRAEEQPSVGDPFVVNGATWVLISSTLTIALFPASIAVAAITMFMIADAAAALVGRRVGKHPWGAHGRTVEGSAAFLVAALSVGLLIVGLRADLSAWQVLASAPVAAAAEAIPRPLNDNIRVPIVAGLVMWLVALL